MNVTNPVFRKAFTVAAAVVLSAAVGCHKKAIDSNIGTMAGAPSTGGNAPTAVITADPLAIDLGQSVVLNWRTQNADTVSIDGIGTVNANGTQEKIVGSIFVAVGWFREVIVRSSAFGIVARGGG